MAKILNREKTIEIRKTAPKEFPCEVYIYCTKNGEQISRGSLRGRLKPLNGKVVAKFTLREAEKIICRPICGEWESYTKTLGYSEISQASCLGNREIVRYLKGNNGYAWHISKLKIFDEPKDIEQFDYPNPSGVVNVSQRSIKGLPNKKRPPQSWCYVEELQ